MLNSIYIKSLYGLYNYMLDFTQGENKKLKIITGPNGYGKTTVLQLIYALLTNDIDLFYQIPFSEVIFSIDNYTIKVVKIRTSVQPDNEKINIYFELEGKKKANIDGPLELVLNSMNCFYLTNKIVLLRNKEQRKHMENADTNASMISMTEKIAKIKEKGDNERGIEFFKELVSFFKFADKEMMVDDKFGIRFKMNNESKTIIPVTALSSGEKHVLLQLFELVFEGKAGDLVMIDEPELSFHPAWLNVYVSVLEKIQAFKLEEEREMQIILATHSNLLVGGRWDETLDLYTLRKNG